MTIYYYRCSTADAERIIRNKEVRADLMVDRGNPEWSANSGPFFYVDTHPVPGTWGYDRGNVLDPADAVVLAFSSNRASFTKEVDRNKWMAAVAASKSDPNALADLKGGMVHISMTRPDTNELQATTAEAAPNALSLIEIVQRGNLSSGVIRAAGNLIKSDQNYVSIVH